MIEARERVQLHPVERLRPPLKSLFPAIWRLIRRRPLIVIAAALIAIDFGFIAIQIAVDATDYGFNGAYRLSLETEMGVAQFYGWVKAGAAAFLMYQTWRRFYSPAAGLWAAGLAYLGIDDALRIHESLGTFFAERLEIDEVGPLRGQDVGELIAYGLIMAIAVTALLVAERRDRGSFPSMLTSIMVPALGVFSIFRGGGRHHRRRVATCAPDCGGRWRRATGAQRHLPDQRGVVEPVERVGRREPRLEDHPADVGKAELVPDDENIHGDRHSPMEHPAP